MSPLNGFDPNANVRNWPILPRGNFDPLQTFDQDPDDLESGPSPAPSRCKVWPFDDQDPLAIVNLVPLHFWFHVAEAVHAFLASPDLKPECGFELSLRFSLLREGEDRCPIVHVELELVPPA